MVEMELAEISLMGIGVLNHSCVALVVQNLDAHHIAVHAEEGEEGVRCDLLNRTEIINKQHATLAIHSHSWVHAGVTLEEILRLPELLPMKGTKLAESCIGARKITASWSILPNDDVCKSGEANAEMTASLEHIFPLEKKLGIDGLFDCSHLDEGFEHPILHESDDFEHFTIGFEDLMDVIERDGDSCVEDRYEEDIVRRLLVFALRGWCFNLASG
jgi:hypothetical protein